MEDLQLGIGLKRRQVLGSNENELAMLHSLGGLDQGLKCNFSCYGIKKHIKLIHDTEWLRETLTKWKKDVRGAREQREQNETHITNLRSPNSLRWPAIKQE